MPHLQNQEVRLIQATLRFYPYQTNANGRRGVWRVIGCREVNAGPYERIYVMVFNTPDFLMPGKSYKALRLIADRMYKKGSRVDPRKMLGLKAHGTPPRSPGKTLTFRRYSPAFARP